MLVHCTQCGTKLRVHQEGPHRCPSCGGVFPVTFPQDNDQAPAIEENLCERCGAMPAQALCPTCNLMVCDHCAEITGDGRAVCHAHARERRQNAPEQRLFTMLRGLLTRPVTTLRQILPDGSLRGRALWFAVVLGTFGAAVSTLWEMALPLAFVDPLSAWLARTFPILETTTTSCTDVAGVVMIAPLMLALGLIVESAMLHLTWRVVGMGAGGFWTTFKIVAYSGAGAVFYVLPVIGMPLAYLYAATLTVIGGAELHAAGRLRSLAGFVLFFGITLGLGYLGLHLMQELGTLTPVPTGEETLI